MKRTEARELAFKLVYSLEMQKEINDEQIEFFLTENEVFAEKDQKYIKDIIIGVQEKKNEIEGLIIKNLKQDWNIERISKINISILKLGIFEMIFEEIPYKVVINEMVELAKKFGEDTSAIFVNGVFASIVKEKKLNEE